MPMADIGDGTLTIPLSDEIRARRAGKRMAQLPPTPEQVSKPIEQVQEEIVK